MQGGRGRMMLVTSLLVFKPSELGLIALICHRFGVEPNSSGLGFMAVVIDLLFDFETCPNFQNWINFTNKSTTESQSL